MNCLVVHPASQGSATGAVTLVLQGEDWHISPNTVNHSQSGNVFMIGTRVVGPDFDLSRIATNYMQVLEGVSSSCYTITLADSQQHFTSCSSRPPWPCIAP